MKKFVFMLMLLPLIIVSSCDTDEDTSMACSNLAVTFTPLWNGEPVANGSEYQDQYGNRLLQFNFKAFLSDFRIISSAEEVTMSEVELLNFSDGAVTLNYEIPSSTEFTEFKFATGVPAVYNVDYDPSSWPNAHPLSVQGAQGMHWSWNTGYIFTAFDGKADTTDVAEPNYLYPFTFHAGSDEFYTEFSFDIDIATQNQTSHNLNFKIDMEQFLSGANEIDIRDDGETHTGGDFDLALQFTENFNSSISLD